MTAVAAFAPVKPEDEVVVAADDFRSPAHVARHAETTSVIVERVLCGTPGDVDRCWR
ncbi:MULTISPECIES: hypothetical protein [unclassified Mycolicibacterium]|uniref:hypothetical protein n=1 Tax=unclassified Mycolicibacterium TaxID=2636767 RepID=UPI0012DC5EC5|nr:MULTISPECIES: hypothetical protein [unclassified Mycolicibacterium]